MSGKIENRDPQMRKTYYVKLDFQDRTLKDLALSYLLSTLFINKICVQENTTKSNRFFPENTHDLIIFDDKYSTEKEISNYCKAYQGVSADTLYVHIGNVLFTDKSVPMISVSKEFFLERFMHVIGFCFLTHVVRNSVISPKGIIKDN